MSVDWNKIQKLRLRYPENEQEFDELLQLSNLDRIDISILLEQHRVICDGFMAAHIINAVINNLRIISFDDILPNLYILVYKNGFVQTNLLSNLATDNKHIYLLQIGEEYVGLYESYILIKTLAEWKQILINVNVELTNNFEYLKQPEVWTIRNINIGFQNSIRLSFIKDFQTFAERISKLTYTNMKLLKYKSILIKLYPGNENLIDKYLKNCNLAETEEKIILSAGALLNSSKL